METFQRFSAFLIKDTISVCSTLVLLNGILDYHVSQNTRNQEATILLKAQGMVQNKRFTLSRFLYQSFPFHKSIYSFAVFHIYDQLLFFISFLSFVTVCVAQHFFGFYRFFLCQQTSYRHQTSLLSINAIRDFHQYCLPFCSKVLCIKKTVQGQARI